MQDKGFPVPENMATKVTVEGSSDSHSKTVAQLLVRRQLAEWVIRNVRIRYAVKTAKAVDIRSCRVQAPQKAYVPEKLPPAEVSGCRFREPDSATWREYHRSSVPPSQIGAR
jgi:hypothetical protein